MFYFVYFFLSHKARRTQSFDFSIFIIFFIKKNSYFFVLLAFV